MTGNAETEVENDCELDNDDNTTRICDFTDITS